MISACMTVARSFASIKKVRDLGDDIDCGQELCLYIKKVRDLGDNDCGQELCLYKEGS